MFKKILFTLMLLASFTVNSPFVYTNNSDYTVLRPIDINTFNEYKYRMAEQYINLDNRFNVTGTIDAEIANRILRLAREGLNYLPDSLVNTNYYNSVKTAIERGILYPRNSSNFQAISTALDNYINKTNIQSVRGSIESFPSSGNAPLTVTLRSNVTDPSGTKLETYNYTWWINDGGRRKVIGNRPSLNYVFNEEGNYSVFLDVTSNHKNSNGFTDVLPFSSRADIEVREKVASLILKVNGASLGNMDELKFTPDDSRYGLLFDATSSTPTSGTRFIRTEWDFGNGLKKVYDGGPRTERIVYASEGEYRVTLKLTTNELKTIERKFNLRINNPIATISSNRDEGFLGDNFTFSANTTSRNPNLTYSWRIIDIKNDKEIFNRNASTFVYSFNEKGMYNVMLYVTEPSGQVDVDTKIIYINSRPPVANLKHTIPNPHNPNTVFFDATASFDPDFSDDGKLTYSWIINGDRVNLDSPNFNGSTGFYTFSSIGEHSVVLEVTDPDGMTDQKTQKINIRSILSVDFNILPRVTQRENVVRFVADSPQAQFFEWDFGDGRRVGGKDSTITHTFSKSGIYNVKLKVIDSNDRENTISKNVYVGDTDSPYAFININDQSSNQVAFDEVACSGEGAYIVNRVDTYSISGAESLDITGENRGLSYSWRLGNSLYNSQSFTRRFDELGCFKVRLVVKSDKNGRESVAEVNVKVENMRPTLSGLDVRVRDTEADPVIVNVSALGAQDRDGVIQSYLWYYYTDLDPEPQDFRATRNDSTSFVLPKITGNYYFVVVMKDNNEARANSEEITGSRYFITLTGDNVNTPLLDLRVNNSSVGVGDEVIFTANAENILGQNLNGVVKFSWDFDGDGFYDKETTSNTTSHVYTTSGEKFARVKVSHKGFSNTKSVTVNVANILKPDFDYVSIGNEYAFFDLSLGAGATYEWDMGDGNIVRKNGSFKYTYEDGRNVHLVKLKVTEGTKVAEITKRVVHNMPNIIKSRQPGLSVFSNHEITEDDVVYLKQPGEKLYFYIGANSGDIANYVADFDIEYDSSLSGGRDDDEDNKNQSSFYSGDPIFIELNNFREQKVRLYTKGSDGRIIESRDIKIIKEYITDEFKDSSEIIFTGVSNSVRLKLERIKNEVDNFPREHKLRGLMYIQRLKDEWNDNREKTNIILEFSNFIDEINIPRGGEIIDILESLLIEGEADRSEKAIAFNALKNLIPVSISCIEEEVLEVDGVRVTCYDLLVAKLEVIGENSNIDENVELGKQILRNIAADPIMSVREKNDFKAILNTFVYGGVSNIPQEEVEQVIENDKIIGSGFSFVDVILTILKIIFGIIVLFSGIIFLFFLYYKVSNKDKNKSFTDFIGEKTSGKKSSGSKNSKNDTIDELEDIFGDDSIGGNIADSKEKVPTEIKKEADPFSYVDDSKTETKNNLIDRNKEDQVIGKTTGDVKNNSSVPDWLKGSFSEDIKEEKVETKKTENDIFSKPQDNILTKKVEEKQVDLPKDEKPIIFENDNKNEDEGNLDIKTDLPKDEKPIIFENETKKEDKINSNIKTDSGIPDWLKGSFSEDVKDEKIENENKKEEENISSKTQDVEKSNDTEKVVSKENDINKNIEVENTETFDFDTQEYIDEEKKDLEKNKTNYNYETVLEEVKEEKIDEIIPEQKEDKKITKTTKTKVVEQKESETKEKPLTIKKVTKDDFSFDIEKEDYIPKLDTKEELDELTKIGLDDDIETNTEIPDWLKGSISGDESKEDKTESTIDEKNQKVETKTKKKITQPKTTKKETTKKEETTDSDDKKSTDSELWDDGMKIPDWLKTDDDNKK